MFSVLFGPEGHPLSHPEIVQGRRGDSLEGGAGRPCGSIGWEAGDTPGERGQRSQVQGQVYHSFMACESSWGGRDNGLGHQAWWLWEHW